MSGLKSRGVTRLVLCPHCDGSQAIYGNAENDQAAEVARRQALGATLADVGQGDVPWLVLAGRAWLRCQKVNLQRF